MSSNPCRSISSSPRHPSVAFATLSIVVAALPLAAAQPQFVASPLEHGVWLNRLETWSSGATGAVPLKAASPGVTAIPGMNDPGSIIRVGNTLYVGDDVPNITVIDATTPGAEVVTGTITPPITPIDLAVVGSEIYVVDQNRNAVWHRPLAGGAWSVINLPPATTEWTYGNICFPHPTLPRLFVIQMWENRVQVVDLVTNSVSGVITALHHLPTSIAFSADGSKMAVLCTGLSAPSCAATGPNLAVFDSTSLAKLYEVNLQGTCSRAIATNGNDAFVVRDFDIRKFDLPSGALIDQTSIANGGRNATHNGAELIVQDFGEKVIVYTDDLDSMVKSYDVVFNAQVWFPPIEEMVTFPSVDGRIFVTCRNDDSVSIVAHDSGCFPYGAGCAGSGGFTPSLKSVGCPHVGQNFTLGVARGLGGAMTFFFAGVAQASLPLGGGCSFLVAPLLPPIFAVPLNGVGPGNGGLALTTVVPATLPVGLVVDMQAIVQDPSGPIGASVSNGIQLTIK